MNDVGRWRVLADSFPCLTRMVACGNAAFSVFNFLLRVWNQYDHSFTLSDTLIWDAGHRKAFVCWAKGRTLGEPLRYF